MRHVLDHGYVLHIESWGSDQRIIEAARMSTDKGFLGWGPIHGPDCPKSRTSMLPCNCIPKPGDEKLLAYLYTHKHMTPFEMAGMVIEVKAPIFIYREWHRHRTIKVIETEPHVDSDLPLFADEPVFSFNEMSARYIPLPDENYMPSAGNIGERVARALGSTNRQMSGADRKAMENLKTGDIENWLAMLQKTYASAQQCYEAGLNMGIPKELCRLPVPVGRYSKMRASANLRNWLAFLTLRMDPGAQYEIRLYANAVANVIEQQFPRTWELFNVGIERISL